MRFIFTLLLLGLLTNGALRAGDGLITDSLAAAPLLPVLEDTRGVPMILSEGMQFEGEGALLKITKINTNQGGVGELYFPALGEKFAADFSALEVNAFGEILRGQIRARTQVQSLLEAAMKARAAASVIERTEEALQTLPLNITSHLRLRQNFALPLESSMTLTEIEVNAEGAFVGLDFAAETVVEDELLDFAGRNLRVNPQTFCLSDAALAIIEGGGTIDDYEFPMRILAGDPDVEGEGSYAIFSCEGFEEFNLSAQYAFPTDQIVASEEGQDTVYASFRINATGLKSFLAFATITPFEIVGVDGMTFRIDSAYVDYSDAENPIGLGADPVSGEQPDMTWKGLFLRRLSITMPDAVSSFNGGKEMSINGENITYAKGKGMSGTLAAYNLLDLSTGSLDGWGFSIDTLETALVQNSIDQFNFRGNVYIPVFDQGDKIGYNCFLETGGDSTSLTLALDIVGKYTVPFLGDVKMELTDNSKAGVRYASGKFEPFLTASGKIDLKIDGSKLGSGIPDINLPDITFQDFKLNDLKMAAASAANAAADQVTAGMDRMSFGTFDWSGPNLGGLMNPMGGDESAPADSTAVAGADATADAGADKSVNGKKVNIKEIKFESVKDGDQDYKRLKLVVQVNLTKGKGGIAGELDLGIQGKLEFGKLISTTPWKALSYHKLEVGALGIQARFGNCTLAGLLRIYDQDPVYGRGFKGGLEFGLDMGQGKNLNIAAMGQFGTAPGPKKDQYDYFFVDFRVNLPQGIPLGSVEITALGGGLYYNMTKSITPVRSETVGTTTINTTPGESFSGSLYTPREHTLGIAAAASVSMPQKKTVFTSDLELTIELDTDNFGLRKILFNGDGYFMLKDATKKDEAVIKARLAMELNYTRGYLSANFAYEVRAPYNDPVLTGGDLNSEERVAALMIDVRPDDDLVYKNYFYFGRPDRPISLKMQMGAFNLTADAYIMLGQGLPAARPLAEVHPKLASLPDISSRNSANDVVFAFGFVLKMKGKTSNGPLLVDFDVVAGIDASMTQYQNTTCANTGDIIGMNGFYLKARAYTYIKAQVDVMVKIGIGSWKVDQQVKLMDLSIVAGLAAELPNPSYLGGKVAVKGSVLGFKIDKQMQFETGEKCDYRISEPTSIVADINTVVATFPVKDSEESNAVDIFAEPAISFAHPVGTDPAAPYDPTRMMRMINDKEQLVRFFVQLGEVELKTKAGEAVAFEQVWDDEHKFLRLEAGSVFKSNTDHILKVTLNWRAKIENGVFGDLKDKDGKPVKEVYEIPFRSGEMPKTINLTMLDSDKHYPGRYQRNWHRNFCQGEIYFKRSGMDEIFATRITKEVQGKGEKEIDCRYAIRLTNLQDNTVKEIPITERPGDLKEQVLEERSKSTSIQTGNGERTVNYTVKEAVTYNSRGIKFNGINDEGVLEKDRIYKLEILRIPISDDVDNVSTESRSVTESATVIDGISIEKTNTTIAGGGGDPFLLPDVIYSYHFRTSKYNSLQEKIEEMVYVEKLKGRYGQDYADIPEMKNIRYSGWSIPQVIMDGMPEVKDEYYLFYIDEGFDDFEQQRIRTNLISIGQMSYATGGPGSDMVNALLQVPDNSIPPVWRQAKKYHREELGETLMAIEFPMDPEYNYSNNNMRPTYLTEEEIVAGQADMYNYRQTGITNYNINNSNAKWDLAVNYKGLRYITFQSNVLLSMGRTMNTVRDDDMYEEWTEGKVDLEYRGGNFRYPLSPFVWQGRSFDAYHDMLRRAEAGFSGKGSKGVTFFGAGTYEKYQGYWSGWKSYTFSYTTLPISWKNNYGYELMPPQVRKKVINTMYRYGPEPPQGAAHDLNIYFYYKDTYNSALESARHGGGRIERTLPNVMEN